jgi:adenosylmethionine-8-amino-7-oxononanoate aminotransferase
VSPDFLCAAKSITGGYLPLAATLTREKIYQAFLGRYDEFKTFFHGHTYTANPLACAVALANLDLYEKKDLLKNVRARAAQLAEGLTELQRHPHVKGIRQIGLMAGIELARADKTPFSPGERVGLRVCDAALRRGLWIRPLGDVIVLLPPLAISEKEINFLLRTLKESIKDVLGDCPHNP